MKSVLFRLLFMTPYRKMSFDRIVKQQYIIVTVQHHRLGMLRIPRCWRSEALRAFSTRESCS